MARTLSTLAKRPRLSIDVEPELRRRLRLAAAQVDLSVRQYVIDAIEARLRDDAVSDRAELTSLTAASDPVLAELWDNEQDAEYDRL